MFKKIFSEHYIAIVRFVEITLFLLMLPLLYNFVPIDKNAQNVLYIDGSDIDTVVHSLENNNYTVTLIDKMMIQMDQLPKSGWYSLNKKEHGRFSFFKSIYKNTTETMNIVVYAGETAKELVNRLANDMKLEKEKLYGAYKKKSSFNEADIFAGHYIVARKIDAEGIIFYLFKQSKEILDLFIEKNFRNMPDHFEQKVLLTIASIIQKESNSIDEMPLISSVIYNRLKKNMKLQMDATLNYGIYSHKIVTPERIKTDNTFYNTYKYKGLPPHPLGTITIDALQAAMFPAKSDHIFFMLKPNGSHQFCATYDKHLENIKIFREYQKKRAEEKEKKEKEEEARKILRDQNLSEDNATASLKEV